MCRCVYESQDVLKRLSITLSQFQLSINMHAFYIASFMYVCAPAVSVPRAVRVCVCALLCVPALCVSRGCVSRESGICACF